MNVIGRILWIIAQLMCVGALVQHWRVNNKLDTIFVLCMAIGLMLASNRIIDDAKKNI